MILVRSRSSSSGRGLRREGADAAAMSRTPSVSGDLFDLTFPGGYLWIEFAHDPEDHRQAPDELLRILDAYADPATKTVTVNAPCAGQGPNYTSAMARQCGVADDVSEEQVAPKPEPSDFAAGRSFDQSPRGASYRRSRPALC